MSKYTTGEMAKLCGITVRTVQYYDQRGLLVPSDLTEGGRRLYSEDDLKKLKAICFLRELDLPIDSISRLFSEDNPENVISLLLDQQEQSLRREIEDKEGKLRRLEDLRDGLKGTASFSVDSIGDIAYTMTNRNELRRLHIITLLIGIPIGVLQWSSIILWITKGIWWLFIVWLAVAIPFAAIFSWVYFRKVDYLCPECHKVFKPSFKEVFFARHTPAARRLTCPSCGHTGYCVEVASAKEAKGNA